jgi:formylglycine-generating enzyme required for sulfatase activity
LVFFVVCGLAFAWHAAGGIGQGGGGGETICVTGDMNGDGQLNISDPVYLLNFLFLGGSEPIPCQAQGTIPASQVSFDPSPSTLEAANVQSAIVELDGQVQALSTAGTALTTRVAALEGNVEIELVDIPPGSFVMGTPPGFGQWSERETRHGVILTRGFKMGAKEVTQAQYRTVMGWNPSTFAGCPECPVETVNWYDAKEFCRLLTERHRTNGTIAPDAFYRLPTEAEWEYACRAGTTTTFFFGNAEECVDENAFCPSGNAFLWFAGNNSSSNNRPKPVGTKLQNPWGLYDMNGNTFEWCQDFYGPYPSGEVTDPVGPAEGSNRVLRGGAWSQGLGFCRSAGWRLETPPAQRLEYAGIRVVLETP